VLFAAYMFIVFGYLSRRCERQADIYGCRLVSTQTFIDALEKVALVNGIARERPGWLSSWQHGTIAQRVAFLRKLEGEPALEPRFQVRLRFLKWSVALGLAAVSVGILVGMRHLLRPEEMWEFLQQL
jgi:STE24 endopeptidase